MPTYLLMPVDSPGEFHLYAADKPEDAVIAHGQPGKMFVVDGEIITAALAATADVDTPPAVSDPIVDTPAPVLATDPAAAAGVAPTSDTGAEPAAADPSPVTTADPLRADSGPIAPGEAGVPDARPTDSAS